MESIDQFDVVVLSDVGSNSFLLCDETFLRSERTANRLRVLAEYVERGGGLVMVGGYMSFSGIDGQGPLRDESACGRLAGEHARTTTIGSRFPRV